MKIFRKLFRLEKQISALELSNNTDELFQQISRRKYWDAIDTDIIKEIFHNADGNFEGIRHFVYISEISNILQNNYLNLVQEKREDILSLFAITLYRLGSDYHQKAIDSKGDDGFKSFALLADMAYMSAILCDKYMLGAYHGMAFLYSFWVDGKTSLEFCEKYKIIEEELLGTHDELLNNFQQGAKHILNKNNLEKSMDEITKYAPHLLQNNEKKDLTYREDIERLEQKILSRP